MERITELADQCLVGEISTKEFRSRMVALLSMMDDDTTGCLCAAIISQRILDQIRASAHN